MKCLLCSAEIDETRPAEPKDSVSAQKALAAELSSWKHVTLVLNGSGQTTLLSGHICPKHTDLSTITLTLGSKK